MASHHHLHHPNHHSTTTCICSCQTTPCHPPPQQPPLSTIDPFLVSSIISQLHQTQNPHYFSSQIKPTFLTQNQTHPNHETSHSHSQFLSSLLQRIDALETSINQFSTISNFTTSSSSSIPRFSLRDAAAKIIQTYFRAFLVHRSRSFRELKQLASVKSAVSSLKSSLSYHGFVDFDYLSHKAMDLLLKLDSIQSGDKMIRDSKKSVTREIVEFLELVDGVCVKRQQAILSRKMKNMRLVREDTRGVNDDKRFRDRNVGPKCRNGGNEERKLMANLRERVERIGKMSKALEKEGEVYGDARVKGFEHFDDDDEDIIGQMTSNYRSQKGRNIGNEEKKLKTNLRERVEKIGRMSKALEEREQDPLVFEEAEVKGFEHVDDEDEDIIGQNTSNHRSTKCRNVGSEEKKLMANLRERVERIGRMSKEQEVVGEAGTKGFKDVDYEDDIIDQIASNYMNNNGLNMKKNGHSLDSKKHVCFLEDRNLVRVYDIDGDTGSTSRLVDVIEDPTKGPHDEEEAQSDEEESSQSSEDLRKSRSDEASEECDNPNEDFTFSTPEPAKKIGTGADFMSRKPGLKIAG